MATLVRRFFDLRFAVSLQLIVGILIAAMIISPLAAYLFVRLVGN
jgi:hypothetical protein